MNTGSDGSSTNEDAVLNSLLSLRQEPIAKMEQRYITKEAILQKIKALKQAGVLEGRRVLAIGDADLTGLSIAIYGEPTEVVVADIDDRLSELLFEANVEYDLQVRFVYHDMRIKIIEILMHQYNLIIMDPPRSEAGVEVFISRAMLCLDRNYPDGVFISVPQNGPIREFFDDYSWKT